MTVNPDVSIIIPAYNTEQYIEQALRSALGQTLQAIEVLLVDDASTDGTLAIASQFADDPRLRILSNSQNLGVSASRNRALSEAKGNWVAVLDSDDWYAPKRLEKLLDVVYAESADIIADDLFLIRDGETSPWSTLISESGMQVNQILTIDLLSFIKTDIYGKKGLKLGLSKPLFKRDFLIANHIKYNEELTIGEDFWFIVECLLHSKKFVLLSQPYYFYRCRPGSLVRQGQMKVLEQSCQTIENFLSREIVKSNPELVDAISFNLEIFRQNLEYQLMVELLKKRKFQHFLSELYKKPENLVVLFRYLLPSINRRFQYHLLRNDSTFDMFPRSFPSHSHIP